MNTVSGWRHLYRYWLGWLPVQFCMVCGKAYWGGLPEFEWRNWRLVNIWQAWMMDYCSTGCCEADMAETDRDSVARRLRAKRRLKLEGAEFWRNCIEIDELRDYAKRLKRAKPIRGGR